MAYQTTSDGRTVTHVSTRKGDEKIAGKDRKGYRAADLRAATTNAYEGLVQQPVVEKPTVMVQTMRIIGRDMKDGSYPKDVLQPLDSALFEFLMLSSKLQSQALEREEYRVPLADVMSYLQTNRLPRVLEGLENLRETIVQYDFVADGWQRKGKMFLLAADVSRCLETGEEVVNVLLHPAVRQCYLASTSFTRLEINAFRHFKSRYTARLYPRLAYIAGLDPHFRKPLVIAPEQLAKEINFPLEDGKLHYGHFKSRCLKPVLKDIERFVQRFKVRLDDESDRAPGRGRPRKTIQFEIAGVARNGLAEERGVRLRKEDYEAANSVDGKHSHDELPSAGLLSKAAGKLGKSVLDVSNAWRATLDAAKGNRAGATPEGIPHSYLLGELDARGVGAAFKLWCESLQKNSTLPSRVKDLRPDVQPVEPAEAATPATAPKPAFELQLRERTVEADPVERHERRKRSTMAAAEQLLGETGNERRMPSAIIADWCDPEHLGGSTLQHDQTETQAKIYAAALAKLRDTQSKQWQRQSFANICRAISEWDIAKLHKTCGAILGNGHHRPLPKAGPQFTPRTASAPAIGEIVDDCPF